MKNTLYKYIQWSSPEALYQECIAWRSELEFIKDEQQFLDELIHSYTFSLISEEVYNQALMLITDLSHEEVVINDLVEGLQTHTNKLEILVDGIDQISEERHYKEAHYQLNIQVDKYKEEFRNTKAKIFALITSIMKQQKQHKRIE